jgi:hypothetical protein
MIPDAGCVLAKIFQRNLNILSQLTLNLHFLVRERMLKTELAVMKCRSVN